MSTPLPAQEPPASLPKIPSKTLHVLLIEDDPGDQRLFAYMLPKEGAIGLELSIAATLEKGLEAAGLKIPDVIVLDFYLPDSQGLESLNILGEKFPDIPVIVVTGLNDDEAGLKAIQRGAQDYLIKGRFDSVQILRILLFAVERKKLLLMREQFVHMVSHEVRNPLAVLKECIQQVLDGIAGPISEDARSLLNLAQHSIGRLVRTSSDLLDLAKMEAGKNAITESDFDLNAMAREMVDFFEMTARTKGIRIETAIPGSPSRVLADRDQIARVWTNLLTNALKFTQTGCIVIRIRHQEKHFECSVEDTGPGLPQEALDRVFNKFEQFGNLASPKGEGSGLGLSIAKTIVEAHGGRIHARNLPGGGACFTFTLPKMASPSPSPDVSG